MTAGFFQWVSTLLALSPYERFEAMRGLDSGGGAFRLLTNKWFVLLGWSLIFILMMVLVAIRQQRSERNRQRMIALFEERANGLGLTMDERELLFLIARQAKLKQPTSVFTLQNAFERGTARLLHKHLGGNADEESARRLNESIETIKEKVGFVRKGTAQGARFRGGRYMTSRQIAVGKTVHVIPPLAADSAPSPVEADVIGNEPGGLRLKLHSSLGLVPGSACTVQAPFGAILWGFEMTVLIGRGLDLELHHVDQARFVNRRRFLRVPVHKPALVAPYAPIIEAGIAGLVKPIFVSAEVKELSGPGLRLRANLGVEERDRLLLIFELEPGRIIQDVAEVRRIQESVAGRVIAVELIGLTEMTEDELIRVTNHLAVRQGTREYETYIEETELEQVNREAPVS